jgi:separase
MLEAIQHKFPYQPTDDLQWPLLNSDGVSLPRPQPKVPRQLSFVDDLDSDEDESTTSNSPLAEYWNAVRTRYQSRILDPSSLSTSQMIGLPSNWTVIHINVTEDKSTLFITRQEGGEDCRSPLIFCVPLKGRRDSGNGQDEEEHLTFENALDELKDVVRLSDEGTKSAIHIKADDQKARTSWWKTRVELDTRMRELLENVEFCWLGAFKVRFLYLSYRLCSRITDDPKSSSKPHT